MKDQKFTLTSVNICVHTVTIFPPTETVMKAPDETMSEHFTMAVTCNPELFILLQ